MAHQLAHICSVSNTSLIERPSGSPEGGANLVFARNTGCETKVSGGELERWKVRGKVMVHKLLFVELVSLGEEISLRHS